MSAAVSKLRTKFIPDTPSERQPRKTGTESIKDNKKKGLRQAGNRGKFML